MKENVLDVLLYLFENYIDAEDTVKPDQHALHSELEQAGFQDIEITKALSWLENMTVLGAQDPRPAASMRFFSDAEAERLDVSCQGYLLFLEQVGVLDVDTREVVIERLMALDSEEIDLDQLKWVVLMVLFYQPGRETAYAWMEDLVFEDMEAVFH